MVPFLLSSIFLFYVALSGNFLDGLFSPEMQLFFHKKIWMKHVFGFLILLFTISFVNTHKSLWTTIGVAFGMYIWFLFTTKLPVQGIVALVLSMAIGFIMAEYLRRSYHVTGEGDDDTDNGDERRNKTREGLIGACIAIFIGVILCTLIATVWLGWKQRKRWNNQPTTDHPRGWRDYLEFLVKFIFTHELSQDYKDYTNITLAEHVARLYDLLGKSGQAEVVRNLST